MRILILTCLFSLCSAQENFYDTTITTTENIKRSFGHMLYGNPEVTPLGINETYTSTLVDTSEYSIISVLVAGAPTNATGTLYIEFSPDGTYWDRSIAIPIKNLSGEPPHTAIPVARYNRIRYVNNAIAQTAFRIQTIFHRNMSKGLTAQLEGPLSDFTDVENSRSIIAGKNSAGDYDNVLIGNNNALEVNIRESTTAFGEISVAEPTAIVQLDYLYGLHPALITLQAHNGATASTENNMLKIATGTSSYASAKAQSTSLIHYNPGQGAFCRLSALFSPGVTGSTQYIGAGDESNGFFFGYNNNTFGILRRQGGTPEVRTLTITNPSTTNENITITLDSVAKNNVGVTNSNNATTTANEIAAADYSNIGMGWTAKAVNNTVVFISWDASSAHTNNYALAGTTAIGTFARTVTGITPTEFFTPQSAWNTDRYDGTGKSQVTLDPTKGNVYQIRWQWLGFGFITYSIENPNTGIFDIVHLEKYSNRNIIPSISSPQLSLFHSVSNTTNTSNIKLYSGSGAGFVDGKENFTGVRGGASGINTNIKDTEIPVLSIRNKLVYQNKINYRKTKINIVSVSSTHSKPVELRTYANPKLTGANFTTTNVLSNTEYDTSATNFSGGFFLFSITLPPNTQQVFFLTEDKYSGILSPGSIFTTTARNIDGSQAGAVSISYNFVELR